MDPGGHNKAPAPPTSSTLRETGTNPNQWPGPQIAGVLSPNPQPSGALPGLVPVPYQQWAYDQPINPSLASSSHACVGTGTSSPIGIERNPYFGQSSNAGLRIPAAGGHGPFHSGPQSAAQAQAIYREDWGPSLQTGRQYAPQLADDTTRPKSSAARHAMPSLEEHWGSSTGYSTPFASGTGQSSTHSLRHLYTAESGHSKSKESPKEDEKLRRNERERHRMEEEMTASMEGLSVSQPASQTEQLGASASNRMGPQSEASSRPIRVLFMGMNRKRIRLRWVQEIITFLIERGGSVRWPEFLKRYNSYIDLSTLQHCPESYFATDLKKYLWYRDNVRFITVVTGPQLKPESVCNHQECNKITIVFLSRINNLR